MKIFTSTLLAAGLTLVALPSFADTPNSANSPNTVSAQPAATVPQKAGEILETLIVINTNEINAAKLALKKSNNAEVKQFAKLMETQHGQNLQQTRKLSKVLKIAPVTSAKSSLLQAAGKQELNKLAALQGDAFDKAYINAMVQGHADVLKLINNELIPNVKNPQLLSHLNATKKTVEHHLQAAQKIQNNLH